MDFFKILFIIVIPVVSLFAQDIVLNFADYEMNFFVPVDTAYRTVQFDPWPEIFPDTLNKTSMTILCPDTMLEPVRYSFMNFYLPVITNMDLSDSSVYSINMLSETDSIWITPSSISTDSEYGINYLNYPGDSISGFVLEIKDVEPAQFFNMDTIRFDLKSSMSSDLRDFHPLQVGNVWKWYCEPSPAWERQEVLDSLCRGDTTFYWVEKRRQESPYYGSIFTIDTLQLFELARDVNRIYFVRKNFKSVLYDFTIGSKEEYQIQVFFFRSVLDTIHCCLFKGWSGGGDTWAYKIGFTLSIADGWATTHRLIGYRVNGLTVGDISTIVNVEKAPLLPEKLEFSCYPNPFNGQTWISFNLPRPLRTRVHIFNIRGQLMWSQNFGRISQGAHRVCWNATDNRGNSVSSGIYIVQLVTPEKSKIIKIALAN